MRSKFRVAALLFILSVVFVSCDKGVVADMYQHIDNSIWTWDDVRSFAFNIEDTDLQHDILIQLRHTTDYPMSNLYIFVEITGPSGQSLRDTINYILAEPNGEWIGKGNGHLRELRYMYRDHTSFPEPGTYSISLEQAMREPRLPVSDIGVRIEKITL
jgi:gliding motility-associated lipoprotein GldH